MVLLKGHLVEFNTVVTVSYTMHHDQIHPPHSLIPTPQFPRFSISLFFCAVFQFFFFDSLI